jgi:hypothetical protein
MSSTPGLLLFVSFCNISLGLRIYGRIGPPPGSIRDIQGSLGPNRGFRRLSRVSRQRQPAPKPAEGFQSAEGGLFAAEGRLFAHFNASAISAAAIDHHANNSGSGCPMPVSAIAISRTTLTIRKATAEAISRFRLRSGVMALFLFAGGLPAF